MDHERHVFALASPATELGTRDALAQIMTALSDLLSPEKAGIVEIVLAEILNNIVEHAYAGQPIGEFRVSAATGAAQLLFSISDDGKPLPGLEPPRSREHDLTGPRDSLPEGGFGWTLIRTMARELHYSREGDANMLRLSFDIAED